MIKLNWITRRLMQGAIACCGTKVIVDSQLNQDWSNIGMVSIGTLLFLSFLLVLVTVCTEPS